MTIRTTDTFTDTTGTNITAHTGELGASWSFATGFSAGTPVITSNRVRSNASGGKVVVASGVAAADGEYNEATVEVLTTGAGYGIMARTHVALGGVARGYMAYYSNSSGLWKFMRLDNSSTFTDLSLSVTNAMSVGTHTVRLTVTGTGASVDLELKIDGSVVLTGSDTSGSRITTYGSAGLYFDSTNSASAGTHIDAVTYADTAVDVSATITSPKDGQVVALSGGSTGTGTIALAGTYTGTAPDQWRLVQDGGSTSVSGFDWASFSSAPTGGTFAQTITSVPKQAGWYNVQVRNSGSPSDITTSGKVAPGVLVVVDGQSNAWLWFSSTSYAGDSSLTANSLLRVTGIQAAGDWDVPATTTMNAAIACGNLLVTTLNCPVALIDGSWDGSGLTVVGNGGRWITSGAAGNAYTASADAVDAAGLPVATIWIQGEGDAGSSVSQSTYYTALGQLIALRRTDLSDADHPYVVVTLARNTAGMTDAQRESIKLAQVQACGDANVYRVDRMDLPLHSDGVHHTATGFTTLGQRCAQAVLAALGEATYYRGPIISSVTQVDSTTLDVNLTLNVAATDITPSSGTTGFRVLVAGSPVTITSADRVAANRVRIVLAAPAGSMPTVQYLYGTAPTITGVQKDNSARALPMEYNAGVLATESSSDAVSAFARRAQSGINFFGNRR